MDRSHKGEVQCTGIITLACLIFELVPFVVFHTWSLFGACPSFTTWGKTGVSCDNLPLLFLSQQILFKLHSCITFIDILEFGLPATHGFKDGWQNGFDEILWHAITCNRFLSKCMHSSLLFMYRTNSKFYFLQLSLTVSMMAYKMAVVRWNSLTHT